MPRQITKSARIVSVATVTTTSSAVVTLPVADVYTFILSMGTATGTSPTCDVSIQVTPDGGTTWKKEKDLQGRIKNIYINPSSSVNDRTIYLAGPNFIQVKEDGRWKMNSAPKDVKNLTACTAGFDSIKNKYIIYAISGKSYFNPDGDVSGIYYTENGGASWENRQDGLLSFAMKGAEFPEWRNVATSALHPGIVYVSYNDLQVNKDTTCIGVAKSVDYGKTWSLVWKDRLGKGPVQGFRGLVLHGSRIRVQPAGVQRYDHSLDRRRGPRGRRSEAIRRIDRMGHGGRLSERA